MKQIIRLFLSGVLFFTSQLTYAQTSPYNVPKGNANSADPNANPSLQTVAAQSKKNNNSAEIWGYVTAGVAFAAATYYGYKCSGQDYSSCALAVLSAASGIYALAQMQKAKNAGKQSFDMCEAVTQVPGCGGAGSDIPNVDTEAGATTADVEEAKEQMEIVVKKLEKNPALIVDITGGKIIDKKTGKTFDFSGDAKKGLAQMNAAGLQGGLEDLQTIAKSSQDKALEILGGRDAVVAGLEDSNAAKPAAVAGADGVNGGVAVPFGFSLAAKNERKLASVEGMTTKFNGEDVGVAQDNLFGMIGRQYDSQEMKGSVDPLLQARPSR